MKFLHCPYCDKVTPHTSDGRGGYICNECGSARLDKIQGFDAELM